MAQRQRRAGSADGIDERRSWHSAGFTNDSLSVCDSGLFISSPRGDNAGMSIPPLGAEATRRLACAHCGATFDCGAGTDHCWCAEETYRLPLPKAGEDCLCPACLRQEAGLAAVTK